MTRLYNTYVVQLSENYTFACVFKNLLYISGGGRRRLGGRAEEETAAAGLGPGQAGWSNRGAAHSNRDATAQAQPALGTISAASLSERQKHQGNLKRVDLQSFHYNHYSIVR